MQNTRGAQAIRRAAALLRIKGHYFAIATLGLLQSSAAVVIGAMLVSPLLGPIMGVGFGLATLESNLIKRSLVTMAAGMAVAIIVAMLIIWVSPIQDVTSELRARTQPTLLDLGVAVVGGIAGVYAIMRKLSGVMVGVAIATALPEAAAAIAAARRGQGDIVAGHVIGSSLVNLLLVVGGIALVSPAHGLAVPESFLRLEWPAALVFALMLLPVLRGDLRVSRNEGIGLLVALVAWIAFELVLLQR